jgi:23S rRNA pseudouridine1911/1915/1917 synthase
VTRRPPEVDEDAILRVLRVPPECEGMRLDRFLPLELRATSRSRAQAIIKASAFSEDGRKLRSSERLKAEQKIYLWRPPLDEEPPREPIGHIYEDDHLLVVNKPPLMTVHPTARHHKHTVIRTLERERPHQTLSLIHRLDRETSGVLLLGKSTEADRAFKIQLEERSLAAARAADLGLPPERADKTYLAITHGVPSEGLCDLPLEDDPSPLRVKVRVTERGRGQSARTTVKVRATAHGYALVECGLHTGRQHQIRVHLAHLGAPLVGDKLYGPDEGLLARAADGQLTEEDLRVLELPRHALHARSHTVRHCFTGQIHHFVAPLPADLRTFWLDRGGRADDFAEPESA